MEVRSITEAFKSYLIKLVWVPLVWSFWVLKASQEVLFPAKILPLSSALCAPAIYRGLAWNKFFLVLFLTEASGFLLTHKVLPFALSQPPPYFTAVMRSQILAAYGAASVK